MGDIKDMGNQTVSSMSFSTVADVFGLDKPKIIKMQGTIPEHRENAINMDILDCDYYQDVLSKSDMMQEMVDEGLKLLPTFGKLAEDAFGILFKNFPALRNPDEMAPSHLINHKVMEKMLESPKYYDLHEKTKLDVIASALGSMVLHEEMIKLIEELQKEEQNKPKDEQLKSKADKLKQMEEESKKLEQEIEGIQQKLLDEGLVVNIIFVPSDFPIPFPDELPPMTPEAAAYMGELRDKLEKKAKLEMEIAKLRADMEQSVDDADIDDAKVDSAVQEAMDEVTEVQEFLDQWGFDSGPHTRIPYTEVKAALERIRNSPKLQELTKLVGRYRDLAVQEQKRKTRDGAMGIVDVKTGNDIQNVLPTEKMAMSSTNNAIRMDFWRRYAEKGLLEHEKANTNKQGKGPMIVCVDGSSSMWSHQYTPEKWSKALALGMLEIAQRDKRHYACILFDTVVDPKEVFIIPSGKLLPEQVLDIAECMPGGGTEFEPPLEKALEIIKDSKFRKADIVFITDGESDIDDDFLKEFLKVKKEKDFRVFSVLINVGTRCSDFALKKFSDEITKISRIADLESDGVAGQLFYKI